MIVPNCNAGGTERVCQRFANYLITQNTNVLVVGLSNNDFPYSLSCNFDKLDGSSVSPYRIVRLYKRIKTLRYLVKKHKISSVISMGEYPNFLLNFIPLTVNKICRITNSTTSLSNFKGIIIRLSLKISYHTSNYTIFPVNRLANELGLSPDSKKVIILPNPIDLIEIKHYSKLQISNINIPSTNYFIHVGQLVEQKDHNTLLYAFAQYISKGGRYNLVLIGKGILEPKIRDLINELNIGKRVYMLGWIDNPLPFIKSARALIMTSKWEGIPNIMLEALTLGCPVISTDCPTGPRDLAEWRVRRINTVR